MPPNSHKNTNRIIEYMCRQNHLFYGQVFYQCGNPDTIFSEYLWQNKRRQVKFDFEDV